MHPVRRTNSRGTRWTESSVKICTRVLFANYVSSAREWGDAIVAGLTKVKAFFQRRILCR